jgi:hypothetical protein
MKCGAATAMLLGAETTPPALFPQAARFADIEFLANLLLRLEKSLPTDSR